MDFTDQVIWVTGASSGIGEGLVRALDLVGAKLILSSRNVDELERVRTTCTRPHDHMVVPLDLSKQTEFPAAAAQVLEHYERIDVLINNGGISQRAYAVDATAESERSLMEVDYFGPVALTKTVLPSIARKRAVAHIISTHTHEAPTTFLGQ